MFRDSIVGNFLALLTYGIVGDAGHAVNPTVACEMTSLDQFPDYGRAVYPVESLHYLVLGNGFVVFRDVVVERVNTAVRERHQNEATHGRM